MRTETTRTLAAAIVLTFALAFGFASSADAQDAAAADWLSLKKDVFGDREIVTGDGKIELEAPIRAEDAATVPLTVRMPAEFAKNVTALTLIVDKNPVPVVATFKYGEAAGNSDRMLSTRVRIDQYSDVRAIAETSDGKLYMTTKFVKASGGCSAPASKDLAEAMKEMGRMRIKTALGSEQPTSGPHEAQVMIKHPNVSGLAMDQLTRAYPPAHFINKVEVTSNGALVFSMEGGISISEDPNLRFSYQGSSSDVMAVKAEDSNGNVFEGKSTPSQS